VTVTIIALVVVAVAIAVARVWSPWRPRLRGPVVHVLPVPLRARLANQAVPLVLLATAAVLAELTGSVVTWLAAVPLVALLAATLIPARYTLTTDGVVVGSLTSRRWTEFSGVTVHRGRVRCKAISGTRGLWIWLPGRFHDADAVAEIRRLIRDAYQGRSVAPQEASESDTERSLATV
jgi:hypothetical protein